MWLYVVWRRLIHASLPAQSLTRLVVACRSFKPPAHTPGIGRLLSVLVLACVCISACGGGSGSGGQSGQADNTDTSGSPSNTAVPTVTNAYLQNPDSTVAVISSLADFRVKARDNVDGGFYSYLKSDGSRGQTLVANELSTWQSTHKSFVTQARDIYSFSRAFMVTGNQSYLEHARHAYDFLVEHGRDEANGGWFFVGDAQGQPADCPGCSPFWNPNSFKWSFVQHYIPLGLGALCEATHEDDVCRMFASAKNDVQKMKDSANRGYFDRADSDFSNQTGKSFASTVDALNTHAFLDAQSGGGLSEVRELASLTTDKFISSFNNSDISFGFPDVFTSNWQIIDESTEGSVGHLLKAGWMLGRTYLLTNDSRYREAAVQAINEVLDNGGWDASNGVPYTSYNWKSGSIDNTNAEYWQIEQAVTSGLINWYIATDDVTAAKFLSMADTSLNFFQNNVIDWRSGGTYAMNSNTGSVVNADKGNSYKAEFHSIELFYYTYLYASLMLQNDPVSLYYSIPESTENPDNNRQFRFNPVEIDDPSLQLLAVTLNGTTIDSFDAVQRLVTLTGSETGVLKLQFGSAR